MQEVVVVIYLGSSSHLLSPETVTPDKRRIFATRRSGAQKKFLNRHLGPGSTFFRLALLDKKKVSRGDAIYLRPNYTLALPKQRAFKKEGQFLGHQFGDVLPLVGALQKGLVLLV